MRITILTTGTRGDTQPFIALGLELQKAGHQVRLAASEAFEEFVTGYGLECYPTRGDVTKIASSDLAKDAMKADNPLKFFKSLNNDQLKSLFLNLQEDLFQACQGSDAIVYHPGAGIGYFIAQHLQIPSILASPFPMTPTRDYPALIFYDTVRLGRTFNLLTHKIFEQGFWLATRSSIKEFWKQHFGHTPKNYTNPFKEQKASSSPTVISCSDHVFQRPADWPEGVHNTGYWFLDPEEEWTPPAELAEFLHKGKPPVYIGFGSIGADLATVQETTSIVIDALKRSGQRGIFATGWSGMTELEQIPEDLFILKGAPHSWLFPQMAAVAHHGGAGTTAAGLRAGVPSIIIPHCNDQFAWGRRIQELGVGPEPISRKRLNAETLADAIQHALTPKIKQTADALGQKIRRENGAETAAAIILNTLETHLKDS